MGGCNSTQGTKDANRRMGQITFYGFVASPPCFLVQAVMDHMYIDYKQTVVIPGKDNKSDWYLKKNPKGKVPLIEEGSWSLDESHAICRYVSA